MRALFVAYPDSLHTQRWIRQLPREWDIRLWYSTQRMSAAERAVAKARSAELPGVRFHPSGGRDLEGDGLDLARLISESKPDLVHCLLIPENGYYAFLARKHLDRFPPWIVSDWGNDLSLFGSISEIKKRSESVLGACDFYWSECHRDISLARNFGFRGAVFAPVPVAGGFRLDRCWSGRFESPSKRRWILVKGYQNERGRALVTLRALELCSDLLGAYRVGVYGALVEPMSAALLAEVRRLRRATGMDIRLLPQVGHLSQLRRHGRARVSIGLSLGDGISTSLLEAMVMGSFPIQSETACASEWIHHRKTGMIVGAENPEETAAALKLALTDDSLVNRAGTENRRVAKERLDFSAIAGRVRACYGLTQAREHDGKAKDASSLRLR